MNRNHTNTGPTRTAGPNRCGFCEEVWPCHGHQLEEADARRATPRADAPPPLDVEETIAKGLGLWLYNRDFHMSHEESIADARAMIAEWVHAARLRAEQEGEGARHGP